MSNRSAWEAARKVLAGGVNSPVRAFRAVGGDPVFLARGEGAWVEDVEGNRYVDFVLSWGPLILGHAAPGVVEAVARAARDGTSFGAPTLLETRLAEIVVRLVPSVERIRFTSSGTEACMAAARLARGATGRPKILKFAGCYHGHGDSFLVAAGSGAATFGVPDSAGVPPAVAGETLVARFNDLASVEALLDAHAGGVAAVFVEPVVGNMGLVPPAPGFLAGLRRLCDEHGALLVLDEVMTGFRVALGGAQVLPLADGARPDLTCLGKVLGGGLPVAAYGGRRDLMDLLAPDGPVYQAGTLSGNPLAMAAGIATLEALERGDPYGRLDALGAALEAGYLDAARAAGVPLVVQRVGSMITPFFTDRPVTDWDSADRCDRAAYGRFHRAMRRRGVLLPPSQFEAHFLSTAHGEAEIGRALEAAREALAEVAAPA